MFLHIVPVDNLQGINQKIEFNEAVTDYVQTAICADFIDHTVCNSSIKYITQGLSIPDDTRSPIAISFEDKLPAYLQSEFIPLSILLVTSTVITI
jgi:hypothetical protein